MLRQSRVVLFLAVSAALIVTAVLLTDGGPAAAPEPSGHLHDSPVPHHPSHSRLRVSLDPTAQRFLRAFLRYEVADPDPTVIRTLRATATPSFATELLRDPPRPSQAPASPRATLGPLAFAVVSADPPLISVSGTAHRATGPEQLSFVFTRRHGRWLASAPGE